MSSPTQPVPLEDRNESEYCGVGIREVSMATDSVVRFVLLFVAV
jgi:hypothetical protein